MCARLGWQSLVRHPRSTLVLPLKPFNPPGCLARRQQAHVQRQAYVASHSHMARRLSTGLIFFIVAIPVALAFGCGYWAGLVTKKEKPNLLEVDRGPKYGDEQALDNAISLLRKSLGTASVSTDAKEIHAHGVSEWYPVNTSRLPAAVIYPRSTEEVSFIASTCHQYNIPMIPYSGGSSLEGHFAAPYGGLSVDFSYMASILAIHPNDMDVQVQPGLGWMDLNEKIKDTGLFFPVDPGPWARIGGMVSTSCSGTNAVRYGTMKDWVINLTVVLADGKIIKTRQRPRKSSAGYNLTSLFIGSEGTLGFVTEATLKLAVIPEETSVAVVNFPTIGAAASAAIEVLRAGVPIGAMEIMDDAQVGILNRTTDTGKTWKEVPTMFFKFSGTKISVKDNIRTVEAITKSHQGGDFHFAESAAEAETLWAARKDALRGIMTLKDDVHEIWSTDVAVPLSRLPEIIEISRQEANHLGIFSCCVGHVGDGNFHESLRYDKTDPEEQDKVRKCVNNMVDRALQMDGTCTGEHGVGLGKKVSLLQELGHPAVDVMRDIKKAVDPKWLMNPGKIFDDTSSKDVAEPLPALSSRIRVVSKYECFNT